jgi:cellulose synthase/poly-beta-1,6-N-acetylglucosamine synthase-like glycosyltransferase
MEILLLIIYAIFSIFILLYSIVQLSLVYSYLKNRKKIEKKLSAIKQVGELPFVTIQLPVFNELYVIERLIDTVAKINYPKDKLEIQVLDDSTDETIQIIEKKVNYWQEQGIDIKQIIRPNRIGFKAGALDGGMKICKGEFIAIFDADFVPEKDFLIKTVPYFQDEKIGVVQTRWEHLNKNYSLLTKLQAFALDAHFSVEQGGRNYADHFINFNGTAGIWRKKAIIDGGGWKADTLTEDLDLSYRAQLKGWKFLFKEDIGSPAELPAEMNALKSQQFRWTKGAAECTVKNLGKVIKHSKYHFWTKVNAVFHLMNSFLFIAIFSIAILSIPLFFLKQNHPEYNTFFKLAALSLFSFAVIGVLYFISFSQGYKNKTIAFLHFLYYYPLFLSFSMGLSLHNSIAVIEGYIGKKSPFIRTPKFSLTNKSGSWKGSKYNKVSISWITITESLLALYFIYGIYLCIQWKDYGMLPFFAMLTLGFGVISYYSFKHSYEK